MASTIAPNFLFSLHKPLQTMVVINSLFIILFASHWHTDSRRARAHTHTHTRTHAHTQLTTFSSLPTMHALLIHHVQCNSPVIWSYTAIAHAFLVAKFHQTQMLARSKQNTRTRNIQGNLWFRTWRVENPKLNAQQRLFLYLPKYWPHDLPGHIISSKQVRSWVCLQYILLVPSRLTRSCVQPC